MRPRGSIGTARPSGNRNPRGRDLAHRTGRRAAAGSGRPHLPRAGRGMRARHLTRMPGRAASAPHRPAARAGPRFDPGPARVCHRVAIGPSPMATGSAPVRPCTTRMRHRKGETLRHRRGPGRMDPRYGSRVRRCRHRTACFASRSPDLGNYCSPGRPSWPLPVAASPGRSSVAERHERGYPPEQIIPQYSVFE